MYHHKTRRSVPTVRQRTTDGTRDPFPNAYDGAAEPMRGRRGIVWRSTINLRPVSKQVRQSYALSTRQPHVRWSSVDPSVDSRPLRRMSCRTRPRSQHDVIEGSTTAERVGFRSPRGGRLGASTGRGIRRSAAPSARGGGGGRRGSGEGGRKWRHAASPAVWMPIAGHEHRLRRERWRDGRVVRRAERRTAGRARLRLRHSCILSGRWGCCW